MTKKEQRAAAWKAYEAIQRPAWKDYKTIEEPALKAYEAIQRPAWKDYGDIQEPAWEAYVAEIERINAEPDEDIIEVDGKRYQLIKKI
jgi:phage gpG-like protein